MVLNILNHHKACFTLHLAVDNPINLENIIAKKTFRRIEPRSEHTKKQRYTKGIQCASHIIVKYAQSNKKLTNEVINNIVVALILGRQVESNTPLKIKTLSHAKSNDYVFAEIAYCTATEVKEKGGDLMAMYCAVVSVLVNRNVKAFRNVLFPKYLHETIVETSIKQVMPLLSLSIDFENDSNLPDLLSDLDANSNRTQSSESLTSFDNFEKGQIANNIVEGSLGFSNVLSSDISQSDVSKELSYLSIMINSDDSQLVAKFDNEKPTSGKVKKRWIETTISDFTIETEISFTDDEN